MNSIQQQQQQQQEQCYSKQNSSLPSPKSLEEQQMMSDDRKQSMMDYQPENMHFQPLTSNLPVSPPHSPVSSKSNAQEEVSTHRPTVPHYHFNFLDDESDPMPYASAQQQKDEALTQTQQQWETKQPVQQQQTMKLKASDFCLERTLGTGSFGRVHLVQSKVNHLYYAMKVLSKELVVRKKQVEHTVNERSVLMAVDYPFLIKLWGTFQDAANLYMVMEFVSGGEVFSLLRKQQKFSEDNARFYAAEVLLSIAYLHSHNIIYRDLKPENLLIDTQGHLKITDFGFAKYVPDVTYTMCGTPDYLAPEIIESKGYGKAVDYWSLGILIYEMLAGYPPFYDENQFRLYEKIVRCNLTFPDHFSPEAKDLLSHLLTTDLTQRYGNLKRGYMDLVDHPWFQSVDFVKIVNRQVKPPFVPVVKNPGDASNFDTYEETKTPYGVDQPDRYGRYFKDF